MGESQKHSKTSNSRLLGKILFQKLGESQNLSKTSHSRLLGKILFEKWANLRISVKPVTVPIWAKYFLKNGESQNLSKLSHSTGLGKILFEKWANLRSAVNPSTVDILDFFLAWGDRGWLIKSCFSVEIFNMGKRESTSLCIAK